jgi:hypothetical protein
MDKFPPYDEDNEPTEFDISEADVRVAVRILYYGETIREHHKATGLGTDTIAKVEDWLFQWIDNGAFLDAIEELNIDEGLISGFALRTSVHALRRECQLRSIKKRILAFERWFTEAGVGKLFSEKRCLGSDCLTPVEQQQLMDYRSQHDKLLSGIHDDTRIVDTQQIPIEFIEAGGMFFGPPRKTAKRKGNPIPTK